MRYDGRWRDRDPKDAPPGVAPVVRLKAPQTGQTVIQDAVQGEVTVENAQLDDMILLRADGTPTYMLAVVVDDQRCRHHPCDPRRRSSEQRLPPAPDHQGHGLARAGLCPYPADPRPRRRQAQQAPRRARRRRLSRHGLLPAALRNYLLRLGWGHGDDEIISTEQAIEWFDLPGVGRSASRFDIAKLTNLNAHYLRETPDAELLPMVLPRIEAKLGGKIDAIGLERIDARPETA